MRCALIARQFRIWLQKLATFGPPNAQSFWGHVLSRGRSQGRRAGAVAGKSTSTQSNCTQVFSSWSDSPLVLMAFPPLLPTRKAWQSKWVPGFPYVAILKSHLWVWEEHGKARPEDYQHLEWLACARTGDCERKCV